MFLKKGDNVIVVAGKDKKKQGKILRVLRARERVVVDGINLIKKRVRPRQAGQKGQTVSIASPIHSSNVQLVDPKSKNKTRVRMKIIDGKKIRVATKSGSQV